MATILIIDDEQDITRILGRLVTMLDHRAITSYDPIDGLKNIIHENLDLVLTDHRMRPFDGSLLSRMLKKVFGPSLPVIIYTAMNPKTGIDADLMQSNADEILYKPSSLTQIEQTINRLIEHPPRDKNLVNAPENILSALARAIESRDEPTGRHVSRIAEMSVGVAKALGQDEETCRRIRIGAQLHDIGKIGIPDAILLKPGPLNAAEFAEMRQHPNIGANIIAPINLHPDIQNIVRHHHEHWNGNGYPNKLSQYDIPLGPRIVAVTDAYDAMVNNRPYRTSLDINEARRRIRNGSGTQFDPQIVDTFLSVYST